MKKTLVQLLKYGFFIALALLFVWLSTRGLNAEKWKELEDALSRANYLLFIPILFMLLLSHWVRAMRWRSLIEPMGYSLSRINVFLGVMIGYFVNLGAPRLGEVLKCTVLARYEKVPADKLVGTIVAERAFDLISLVVVFGITFIVQFDVIMALTVSKILPAFRQEDGQVSVAKVLVIIALIVLFIWLLKFLFSRFSHIGLIRKISNVAKGIWQGVMSIKDVKNKWVFIFQSAFIWVLYLLSTWLGFYALPETSHLGISQAMAVLAMGSIGMIVSPGGIGAYAYLIQQTVVFYSIPETPYGLALGWLLWFGQTATFIVCGVLSFILLPILNKKTRDEKSGDNTAKNIQPV